MEAYRVLGKPGTRRNYDINIDSRPVYSTGFANAAEAHDFEYVFEMFEIIMLKL